MLKLREYAKQTHANRVGNKGERYLRQKDVFSSAL